MASVPAPHRHSRTLYDALAALPEGVTGEIIDGQLHVVPRPSGPHGFAASGIGGDPFNPYSRGRGGPGGWSIIDEPEVHFVRDVEVATFDGTSPIRVAPFEDVEISPPWE